MSNTRCRRPLANIAGWGLKLIGACLSANALADAQSHAAQAVNELIDDFVYGSLALTPAAATGIGYHLHGQTVLDDQLDDLGPAGIAAARDLVAQISARVGSLDGSSLDAEERADVRLVRDALEVQRLELDEIQSYKHNPTLYVETIGNGLFSPFILQYAPLEDRYAHIINRLRQVPAFIKQAQRNLQSAPAVWTRAAVDEDTGNIALIRGTLRENCPPPLRDAYEAAAAGALASLNQFDGWLNTQLIHRPSDWRLGARLYDKKFRATLETDTAPLTLLKEAEDDLKRVQREMQRLAAPLTVAEALAQTAAQHPTPGSYLETARQALQTAFQFVATHRLVTLPAGNNLEVIETPQFLRESYTVGGFNAAPALEPNLGAFYWVTPIPSDWPTARSESKLREYNYSGLAHLTVHEAMPGHYVQAQYANQVEPEARRLLRIVYGNVPYVEGWAFYAQHMMQEQGYLSDSPGYHLTMQKQLLRALGNAIIDIRLQTHQMTDQQALDLLINGTYQERQEAVEKLQRAKLSSCQLATYYAGFKGWLQVRDHYRNSQQNGFELRQFHDRALAEGAVALPDLNELLTVSGAK